MLKEKEKQRLEPTQENIVQLIKDITTGTNSEQYCTSHDIHKHLKNDNTLYRKLESIREHLDSVEAHHTSVADIDHDGPPCWTYTYKE